MARRKGSYTFDVDEYPKLSRNDFDKVKELFRRYDYNGTGNIKKPELLDILKDMGASMTESLKKRVGDDLEKQGIRSIDLGIALQMVNQVREWEEDDDADLNDDYVNAFVAMGGNPDRSGIVRKDTILNLIKDFELTFDIEDFFEKSSLHADDLDFQAFCTLFEGDPNDERSVSRANSLISLMSERTKKKDKTGDAFTVRYRDFEKFMLKEKEKGKWFLV